MQALLEWSGERRVAIDVEGTGGKRSSEAGRIADGGVVHDDVSVRVELSSPANLLKTVKEHSVRYRATGWVRQLRYREWKGWRGGRDQLQLAGSEG